MADRCMTNEECAREMNRLWDEVGRTNESGLRGESKTNHEILVEMRGFSKATAFWGKVIAGLLTIIFAAATVYFYSLEARGKARSILLTPHAEVYAENNNKLNSNAGEEFDQIAIGDKYTWQTNLLSKK